MIGREQGSDISEILIDCYVSSITTAETLKSFRGRLTSDFEVSSRSVSQKLTQLQVHPP